MRHQNEKKVMKSPDVCSGAGPARHMVTLLLRWKKSFPQWLQIHLILALFAGHALCAEISTTPTSITTAQSGQAVIYFLEVTVNVNGPTKNTQDIIDWLLPVFQNNLQTCGSPVIATTSTTTISTNTSVVTTTNAFTNSTPQSTTISTTLGLNTTKTSITTQNHTTTAVTTIISTSTTATTATTPSTSTTPGTATTPNRTTTLDTTTTSGTTTTPGPTTTSGTTTTPGTTTTSGTTTAPAITTTLTTAAATTQKTESTSKSTDTTTSQSLSITTALTTTGQTNKPTTDTTTHTTSSVTTAAETAAPTSSVLVTVTKDKPKPSNNPNPNSQKSSVRKVRQINSVKATGLFQDFEVSCLESTSITNTICYVTLTLTESVNPCCILRTLCAASKTSTNIYVTGNKAERAGSLQQNNTQCSNPSADVCVYTGLSGATCDESEAAYGVPPNNLTQCGAENKCNCSAYCSKTDAYYTFNISTENSIITELYLKYLLSTLRNPLTCPISVCPSSNIASKYKDGSLACSKTTTTLSCTVILLFSETIPICALSELVTSLLKSQNIIMKGLLTRAAICGNTEGSASLLQSPFKLVDVNLKPDQFCTAVEQSKPFTCQTEERVIVMLDEQCGLASTTATPNVTTTTQPNTTLSVNVTTIPANITTISANVTTISANETMNTTAITNATTTPVNESTTVTPSNTTTEDSNLAMANALLEMTKNASNLNSSQVDQLVTTLGNLLSGPNVSLALGTVSVSIVSNLQNASLEAVDNSKNRIMGIVDTVGQKLVLRGSSESILSEAVALSVQQADGTKFEETYFSISDPNNVQVGIPRARRAVKEDSSSVPQGSIRLPPTLTENLTTEQKQMVSRVQFNFYQKSTLFQDKALGDRRLNSGILGASVANVSISELQDDVIIHLRNTHPVPANYVATCVFWDFTFNNGSGGWNPKGCKVRNNTANETICGCDHLTSFAILLDLSRRPANISREQATILTFITYIGCGISSIFLAVTLLTYLAFGKLRKDIPSKILIQLCFALLLLNLVFLVDAWLALYPDAVGLCISTAWFLHYFLLVAFTWMGLEAVHMYIALVKVFNTHISHYMLKFSLAGWGIPMLVVIIVIAINKDNYGHVSYGKFSDGTSDDFCWINNDIAFYVAVVAYFCAIFLLNVVMFIVVMVQLCRIKRQNPHNLQHRTTLQDARSVVGITILLGLTWGFAFFAWGPLNLPFMYLFAIFNSFQGFFIFIFHCAVKENVRRQWRTYLCFGKMRLAENSDWSRTATQKTTKKSSVSRLTSLHSSKSNNSSSSSSYLVSDSSDQINGFGSPFSDRIITADEDPSMDVILNDLNSQYRRL